LPLIHPAARRPRPEDEEALVRALALVLIRAAVLPSDASAPQHEKAA
jgi:hypothetical protein